MIRSLQNVPKGNDTCFEKSIGKQEWVQRNSPNGEGQCLAWNRKKGKLGGRLRDRKAASNAGRASVCRIGKVDSKCPQGTENNNWGCC